MSPPEFKVKETVRTVPELTRKDFVGPLSYKRARRPNAPGILTGVLSRWYLVLHEDGETGLYEADELEAEARAYWIVTHDLPGGVTYLKEIATYEGVETYIAELVKQGHGVTTRIEGPVYADKVLSEGPQEPKTLFEHLLTDL